MKLKSKGALKRKTEDSGPAGVRFLMIKHVTPSSRIGVITAKLLMKSMLFIHVNYSHSDLAETYK